MSPRHDIPFDPLTREARRLTLPGEKRVTRGSRATKWTAGLARRFGGFIRDMPDRRQFAAWARLKRAGKAPPHHDFEIRWQNFLNQ